MHALSSSVFLWQYASVGLTLCVRTGSGLPSFLDKSSEVWVTGCCKSNVSEGNCCPVVTSLAFYVAFAKARLMDLWHYNILFNQMANWLTHFLT